MEHPCHVHVCVCVHTPVGALMWLCTCVPTCVCVHMKVELWVCPHAWGPGEQVVVRRGMLGCACGCQPQPCTSAATCTWPGPPADSHETLRLDSRAQLCPELLSGHGRPLPLSDAEATVSHQRFSRRCGRALRSRPHAHSCPACQAPEKGLLCHYQGPVLPSVPGHGVAQAPGQVG